MKNRIHQNFYVIELEERLEMGAWNIEYKGDNESSKKGLNKDGKDGADAKGGKDGIDGVDGKNSGIHIKIKTKK